ESARGDRDQLQECLQAMKSTKRGGSRNLCTGIGNSDLIRLVVAELQHSIESLVGVHRQRRSRTGLGTKRNPRLPRKLRDEPPHASLERWIGSACDAYRERRCDSEHAAALLHAGRQGHQVELWLGLG